MKLQSTVMSFWKRLTHVFVMLCLMAMPLIGMSQPPGPGGGGGGGNPDDAVPFDANMNLMFLAVGIVFAAIVITKQLKRKAIKTA